jgi:murein tripeptide amidase MpaA
MQIDSNFECGNITVEQADDTTATLTIRPDSGAAYYQWFAFRVQAEPGVLRTYTIANAGTSSYPRAWTGYRALASYDGQNWFRVHTQYIDDAKLVIRHRAESETTWYAFFVPYTEAMRARLLDDCVAGGARRETLVMTQDGRPVELVVVGGPQPSKKVWIIARQHSGESMAEYAVEGMLRRLLDRNDPVAKRLLDRGIAFYIVPNMNPDGSARGNLRANAAGVDLNRVWLNPPESAPEVAVVRSRMESEGCHFFIDMHGDEERPFIWLVQAHPANVRPGLENAQKQFEDEIARRYAEYGPRPGAIPAPTNAASGMSIDWAAAELGCPSWIIELPFKDTIGANGEPDSLLPAGCLQFGRDCLEIIDTMM